MKKLINDPRQIVRETLEGLVDLSPDLALLADFNVIIRSNLPEAGKRAVAIISGGGSGHEPAHAGYVGEGMLTAAVAGDVFTSPSVDAVLSAILSAAGPAGAVLIVKNYTGDRLNFGLAAELARERGIPTEIVVVADDVALKNTVARERWRGIAGTVFIHKIAGAAAADGKPLAEVAALANAAAGDVVTMGVGLGACIVPTAGKAGFALGENEIEFGLGIHGEKGVSREAMASADAIVDRLVDAILDAAGDMNGRPLALLVNGLGATPPMELSIVARRALQHLRGLGHDVRRAWAGDFMTALEMPGCSLSLLPLDDTRMQLLDRPVSARAWPGGGIVEATRKVVAGPAIDQEEFVEKGTAGPLASRMRAVISAVAAALIEAEEKLTDLDSRAGDGDLGASMERGARALQALPDHAFHSPYLLLSSAAKRLRSAIAGSSGPFYATALMRASRSLQGKSEPDGADWLEAFGEAVAAIPEIGGAKAGDRTMLDALQPALDAWQAIPEDAANGWRAAAEAAETGAEATSKMRPGLGRASYLGDRAIGVSDGGAVAVTIWMRAILESIAK